MTVVTLTDARLDWLKASIDQLNKRAIKLGIVCGTIDHVSTEKVQSEDRMYWYNMHTVSVIGPIVSLSGFTFAAVSTSDGILRKNPCYDGDIPSGYWTFTGDCDHCGYTRNRKATYLLHNDGDLSPSGYYSREWVNVGSSCLASFLGNDSAESIAQLIESFSNTITDASEDNGMGGMRGDKEYDLSSILVVAAAVIRQHGYVSGTQANIDPTLISTKTRVMEQFNPKPISKVTIEDCDGDRATKALDWGKLHFVNPKTEYDYNMTLILGLEYITPRMVGFAISVFGAYARALEQEIKNQNRSDANSTHQGSIGDKLSFTGTVTFVKELDGNYGVTYLVKFVDDNGNGYTWFASNNVCDQGDKVTVKGTVKKHDQYNGINTTVITRCKVMELN